LTAARPAVRCGSGQQSCRARRSVLPLHAAVCVRVWSRRSRRTSGSPDPATCSGSTSSCRAQAGVPAAARWQKRMPETRRQRFWAETSGCARRRRAVRGPGDGIEYETKTRGPRVQPPARPAGRACTRSRDTATRAPGLTGSSCPAVRRGAARAAHPAGGELHRRRVHPEAPAKLGRRPPHVEPLPDGCAAKFRGRKIRSTGSDLLDVAAWSWCSSARPTTWRRAGIPPRRALRAARPARRSAPGPARAPAGPAVDGRGGDPSVQCLVLLEMFVEEPQHGGPGAVLIRLLG